MAFEILKNEGFEFSVWPKNVNENPGEKLLEWFENEKAEERKAKEH